MKDLTDLYFIIQV